MNKKKRKLYGTILAVFCIFWVIYISVILRVMDKSSRQSLQQEIALSEKQIAKDLEYRIKDLAYALELSAAGSYDKNQLSSILDALEQQSPRHLFGISDGAGVLTDRSGNRLPTSLNASQLQPSLKQGYALFCLPNEELEWEYIALVVPIPGNESLFLAELRGTEDFVQDLAQGLAVSPSYLAIYNEWGTYIASAPAWEPDDDVAKSVQRGANSYLTGDRLSIQKTGFAPSYNIYIQLDQPQDWFLGGRVDTTDMTLYFTLLQITILAFGVWILFVCVVIGLDIYNDREKQNILARISKMDPLTKLANSSGMEEAVSDFFQDRSMKGYSLVYMDIVGFHRFNTMFGHLVGDTLLRAVGEVITIYYHCGVRMGNDIFAFLEKSSPTLAGDTEHRLYEMIEKTLGKQYIQMISFRFGVYPILKDGMSFRDIYDGALLALRDAKMSPEVREVVYDKRIQQSADLRRDIEINMLHALSKGEFLVYIQPKFDVLTETCCGGEVLVRWQSERMGFLSPAEFIPLFEKNGFIVEIDFFMLNSAMRIIQQQLATTGKAHPLSVNQSKVTITFPNYLERLESVMGNYPIPLHYVELEITESILETDRETILPLIQKIKALGFRVSMDDFGTGFSSLNTLRELPVDVLKIDKGFLQESDTSGRSSKIIRNIITMARELDIGVVCEGVENQAQLRFLKSVGCPVAQGFLFSKPIPQEEFLEKYASDACPLEN